MRPVFPLIAISKEFFLDLIPAETRLSRVSTLSLISHADYSTATLYDSHGYKWNCKQVPVKFRNTLLVRLLARTIYSPRVNVEVIWTKIGPYQLEELRSGLKICVDKDDDIITQFEEADVIKKDIDKAMTFARIVELIYKYVLAVGDDKDWDKRI